MYGKVYSETYEEDQNVDKTTKTGHFPTSGISRIIAPGRGIYQHFVTKTTESCRWQCSRNRRVMFHEEKLQRRT